MGEEKSSDYYDDFVERAITAREEGIYDELYGAVADLMGEPSDMIVLDVGCGVGGFAKLLKERGWSSYMGLDFSSLCIDKARRYVPEYAFFVKNIYEIVPLMYGTSNIVVFVEVLEHLERDIEVIENIPDGRRVIFSVPDFDCPSHIRHFNNEKEVIDRYEGLFQDFSIKTIETIGHRYFIVRAHR